MPKGATFDNDILLLTFNGTAFSWNGNSTLYVSLHSADPTSAGNQTTNEVAYTSYSRVSVARTSGGFTVTGASVTNAGVITFPTCTGGSVTATNFAIGTAASGTGEILYTGALTSSLAISNNVQPQFNAGQLTVTES